MNDTNASSTRQNMSLQHEILFELVRMHARLMRFLPLLDVVMIVALAYILRPQVPDRSLALWASLVLGVSIVRALYSAWVYGRGAVIDPRREYFILVMIAGFSSASIGLLPLMAFTYSTTGQIVLIVALLLGYTAGGIGVSPSPLIQTVWSLPMMAELGYAFHQVQPGLGLATFVLCGANLLYYIAVAYSARNVLLQSIVTRHQRDALVMDLEKSNAEVREALLKVEESAQTRARVLAAASHDLRQPLHALSLYSAVLSSNLTPQALREVSRNIDQIVRSLGNLLNGLLDLSRLSAGNYTPEDRSFALDRIVQGVCTEFEGRAAEKRLVFSRDLGAARIRSDPTAVARITRNLLDNAVKYTDEGRIAVITRVENGSAILSVIDSGKGIPKSLHGRIFEEFYQVDNPGRDRSKGVGLGLTLVQRLCELIHAEITLESEPGAGSCFHIRFPQLLSGDIAAEPPEAHTPQFRLDGKRVYVVDDEGDIQNSMRALLEVWGLSTFTTSSPMMLERLFHDQGMPDLLIVDLRLGGTEHGAQLARRMQLLHGTFPVLVMTGETSSEALLEANRQNYPLLQKPIAPEVLHAAIAEILQ